MPATVKGPQLPARFAGCSRDQTPFSEAPIHASADREHGAQAPFEAAGDFSQRHAALLLAAIVLVAAILRAIHIGGVSLWNDELFSRYYSALPLHFLWTTGFGLETTPPTYYTLLHFWMELFGTGQAAMRSLSAICSVGAIPLVYLLAREFTSRAGGLLAACLFAVSPMQIYFAQEARAYALLLLPVSVALIGMARFLRDPRIAHLILYAAGATIAVYVHTTANLLLVALNLSFLAYVAIAWRETGTRSLLLWIAANMAVAALCLPEALATLGEMHADRLSWMTPTNAHDVAISIGAVIAGPSLYPPKLGALLAIILLGGLACGAWIVRLDRRAVIVLVLVPLIDFALILLATLHQPILLPRILCWMGIPFSVLLARLLVARSRVRLPLAAAGGAILLAGLAFQLAGSRDGQEPWHDFLARLRPEIAQADIVAIGPRTEPTPFAYYGAGMTKVRHWTEDLPPTVESTVLAKAIGARDISRADLLSAIHQGRKVLVIQRLIEYPFQKLLTGGNPPQDTILWNCGHNSCLEALYWHAGQSASR